MTRTLDIPAGIAAHDIPIWATYQRLAGPDRSTYATGVDVAYITGRHPNTIYAALARLVAAGLITQVQQPGSGRGITTLTTLHR